MFDHPSIDKLRATIRAGNTPTEHTTMKTLETIARSAKIEPSAVKAAATLAGVQPSEFNAGVAHYDAPAERTILETLLAGRKASASADRATREAKAKVKQPATLRDVEERLTSALGLHGAKGFTLDMIGRVYAAQENREIEDDIAHVLETSQERADRRQRHSGSKNISIHMMMKATKASGKKIIARN